jgi:effector-binding domain-containing protein
MKQTADSYMLSEPKIKYREKRHYVAISKTVSMYDIPQVLPPLVPQVKDWMAANKVAAAGPDFFLYKSMNEKGELECEVGFEVHDAVAGEGQIKPGIFPACTYASLVYTGDFKDMMQGHMALEEWIREEGFQEKIQQSGGKISWGSRTEFYLVDPDNEPDSSKWQTEIVFQLED